MSGTITGFGDRVAAFLFDAGLAMAAFTAAMLAQLRRPGRLAQARAPVADDAATTCDGDAPGGPPPGSQTSSARPRNRARS